MSLTSLLAGGKCQLTLPLGGDGADRAGTSEAVCTGSASTRTLSGFYFMCIFLINFKIFIHVKDTLKM